MSPFLDATTIPSPSDLPLKSLKVPELQQTNRIEDTIASLQEQLVRIEKEIYIMNDGGKKFNLNSPKQVSLILFGRPDLSTNKATLEGMAANNIMAKLILEYRITKQQLQKLNKKQQLYKHTQTTNTPLHNDHDPLWLIDTSSFIFRAYYSMPPLHRSPDGMPIGAVMGFCNMLNKLVWNDMFRRTHQHTKRIVLCLDAPTAEHAEARTFRHELYPDYKAHRPSLPLDLIPQFDLVQKAAKAYGIVQIQAQGYEADDVMATLSTKACRDEQLHVRILSGDKDLMQLITEDDDHSSERGSIHMIDPMTMTPWTAATVVEKWGVPAHQLGDVLALAGDTADNVPGVPGIGPKIAAQLLQEYQTLDNLLARTDEIKQKGRREKLETYKNQALLSRDLVELVCDLEWSQMEVFYPNEDTPVILENDTDDEEAQDDPIKVGDLRLQTIDPDRLLAFYDEMGFYTMKQRFLEKLKQYEALHGSLGGTGTSFSSAEEAKPKKKSKWTPRKKMGIPKPEDYKDVPF
jgi:DNA polymerase-1